MKITKFSVAMTLVIMLLGSGVRASPIGLLDLTDDEMATVEGQALFNLSYLAPGDAGNPAVNNSFGTNTGFYTLGMEATVEMNANIKTLQLGCGGINGEGGCDIDGQNVSFGCIADASGNCTSLAPVTQSNGVTQISGAVLGSEANQAKMKDFVMNNPFFQFAIKNPNSPSQREVVGFRVGAVNVSGPLSFGSLNSFSGYLTGRTNLAMRGQGPNRNGVTGNLPGDLEDVAATCQSGTGCTAGNTSDYTNNPSPVTANNQSGGLMNAYQFLGLDNEDIALGITLNDATVGYETVTRTNLPVVASGVRQTQAFVSNVNLGMSAGGAVKAITDSMQIMRETTALSPALLNAALGLFRTAVGNKIVAQLAGGLGTTVADINNDTYKLPFNVSNVHQLNIATDTFGISLQKDDMQYPGYTAAVTRGWAMYAPEAFILSINRRTSEFVQNIVTSPDAKNGNIVGLEPAYRNCWGTLNFC